MQFKNCCLFYFLLSTIVVFGQNDFGEKNKFYNYLQINIIIIKENIDYNNSHIYFSKLSLTTQIVKKIVLIGNTLQDEIAKKSKEQQQLDAIDEVKRNQILLLIIIILFVLGIISLLYYSKKIKISNRQLEFYFQENAFLLKEANHRINNNLQLIIVLLNEELDKNDCSNSDNSSIKKILAKVESISTLHRHLYKSTDKKTVDIKEYLNEIVTNFDAIFCEKEIEVKYKIEKINLPIDLSMYIGLLITELFINSIKHAFKNKKNRIILLQLNNKNSVLHIDYSDNGENSIGKKITPNLAITICKQIKANFKIETKLGFEMYITKDLTQ